MTNKKISQLNDGGSFQSGDQAVINRGGANFRVDPTTFTSLTVTGDVNFQDSVDYQVELRGTVPTVDTIQMASRFRDDTNSSYWGGANVQFNRDGNWQSSITLNTSPDFANRAGLTRVNIQSNGNVAFFEDTGTTPLFLWDATTERLGVGTSSPSAKLEVDASLASQTAPQEAIRLAGPNTPYTENSGQDIRWQFDFAGSSIIRGWRGSSWDTYLGFHVTAASAGANTPVEVMRIDEAGIDITGTVTGDALALATGSTVVSILDEDNMASDSDTALATQQSIKAYVDAQIGAGNDLDISTDSGAITIDLSTETLTVTGGSGIDTSAAGNTVTVAIDSTVATLTGTQTLTNKTLTSPDINTPDIDGGNIDGTVIGATTPAAATFTTGDFNTSLNVDGTVTADGLTVAGTTTLTGDFNVEGSSDYGVEFRGTSPSVDSIALQARFRDDTDAAYWGGANIQFTRDGNWQSSVTINTSPDYTNRGGLARLNISKDGDLSLYEDTGTTPKVFWDASAERFGIGNSSPSSTLDVTGTITADGLTVDTGTISFAGATVSDGGTVTTVDINGGDIASAVTINKSPTVTLTGAITGAGTLTNLGSVSIATTATSDPTLTMAGDITGAATFTNLGNATLTATVVGGDVDTAAKWTTARTLSLTGAVTGSASVDGSANVSIATTHTADPTITLTGAVTGSGTMTNLGNVSIATTATSDPTLTLSGDATGSATFTNLGNATLSVTVVDDSHNHIISNVDGLQTALDGKLSLTGGTMTGDLKFTNNNAVYFESNANGGFIPVPGGGSYIGGASGPTGAIKITLPVHGPTDMISFHVDIFDYSTNESCSVFIAGYAYQTTGGNEWVNTTARIETGLAAKDFNVRFGADGSKSCVWIGETSSTWSYPQITVRDVQVGYTADVDAWADGWDVGFVTAFNTVDETRSGNLPVASSAAKWTTARTLSLTGAVTGSASVDGSGNVSLATTATSDPTLTLSGDVTGSATFTNLGNATLTATVVNDSHTHDTRYYTESESDSRFVNVTGDTMTGDLYMGNGTGQDRILIQKADNNVADHIIFYNGTTRVGEIGCRDTTWLRLNAQTAKNIYTNRYIRSDGGFFVDGTTYGINGSGKLLGNTGKVFGNLEVTGGVYLGGTAAANLLDDYEEGTFTPVLTGSTSGTFNGTGKYTKIGDMVAVYMEFANISTGTKPIGNYQITGLPFTSRATTPGLTMLNIGATARVTFNTSKILNAYIAASSSTVPLIEIVSNNTATSVTDANFVNAGFMFFRVSGVYPV